MTELVVVKGDKRERVLFETPGAPASQGGRGSDGEVSIKEWFNDRFHDESDPTSIADIGATIQEVAASAASAFRGMGTDVADGGNFSEAEVVFGLKVSAEGNAFVAKSGVEAHVSVTFKWDFSA